MKTLELDLKKKVLIVDENDFDYYELFKEGIYLKLANGDRDFIEGEFEYKCKGSELTEEIAREICNGIMQTDSDFNHFIRNKNNSAIEDFNDYLEIKGFHWLENPFKYERKKSEIFADENNMCRYISKEESNWQEAEAKTFRNPLIFIKK